MNEKTKGLNIMAVISISILAVAFASISGIITASEAGLSQTSNMSSNGRQLTEIIGDNSFTRFSIGTSDNPKATGLNNERRLVLKFGKMHLAFPNENKIKYAYSSPYPYNVWSGPFDAAETLLGVCSPTSPALGVGREKACIAFLSCYVIPDSPPFIGYTYGSNATWNPWFVIKKSGPGAIFLAPSLVVNKNDTVYIAVEEYNTTTGDWTVWMNSFPIDSNSLADIGPWVEITSAPSVPLTINDTSVSMVGDVYGGSHIVWVNQSTGYTEHVRIGWPGLWVITPIPGSFGGKHPCIDFDGNTNMLQMVYERGGDIYYQYSNDLGDIWSTPVVVWPKWGMDSSPVIDAGIVTWHKSLWWRGTRFNLICCSVSPFVKDVGIEMVIDQPQVVHDGTSYIVWTRGIGPTYDIWFDDLPNP